MQEHNPLGHTNAGFFSEPFWSPPASSWSGSFNRLGHSSILYIAIRGTGEVYYKSIFNSMYAQYPYSKSFITKELIRGLVYPSSEMCCYLRVHVSLFLLVNVITFLRCFQTSYSGLFYQMTCARNISWSMGPRQDASCLCSAFSRAIYPTQLVQKGELLCSCKLFQAPLNHNSTHLHKASSIHQNFLHV